MFHRCVSLKERTSWSKWTSLGKAERRIRCRMQRFYVRGRLSVNWGATVACFETCSETQCLLQLVADAWVEVVKMPDWELVDSPSMWIWAVTSDTNCLGLRSHCVTKRAISLAILGNKKVGETWENRVGCPGKNIVMWAAWAGNAAGLVERPTATSLRKGMIDWKAGNSRIGLDPGVVRKRWDFHRLKEKLMT